MTDNKFTAMMWEQESHYTDAAERCPMFLAGVPASKAADWRAMREAWKAMVGVCEMVSYGLYTEPENCIAEATAALTKARSK